MELTNYIDIDCSAESSLFVSRFVPFDSAENNFPEFTDLEIIKDLLKKGLLEISDLEGNV